jgi:hypothetical protein
VSDVRRVHLVAKTHLDLGFTALASEVEASYLGDLFPRALATARELRASGATERLVWTTGSWILARALDDPDPARAAAVAAGVERGDLAWHALPVTTHTELMDAPLVRHGLGISARLDERFGRATTAAKMTDVPGHTIGLVPLLAEAGVTFLHLGVNPAWPVPEVPPVFRWRAPDGSEVTVAYQEGGYGGEVVVPGCDEALAFLHGGDNLGPPTAAEVIAAHERLAARHPGAEVVASTLDAFARALVASGAEAALPVVTDEIGDPWLFGAGSDPVKVAGFRRALAARRADGMDPEVVGAIDDRLLRVAEHTWGLDQKVVLPAERPWHDDALADLRADPVGRRFEASWGEQRAYVDAALFLLGVTGGGPVPGEEEVTGDGWEPIEVGAELLLAGWRVVLGPDGALAHLEAVGSGRVLGDGDHRLGRVARQTFDEADYERFYQQLTPSPEDEWWARRDNTKSGIDAAGAVSGWDPAQVVAAGVRRHPGGAELLAELSLAPTAGLRARWSFDAGGRRAALDLSWLDKAPTRLPEAWWCSFVPTVTEPQRWTFDKLGLEISPLRVVRRGGRALHAVGAGCSYDGPDGPLHLATPDAPLVAPGTPRLLDADPPVPDLAGGLHLLLHDNCWGTNFPMWFEGPASFRFELTLGGGSGSTSGGSR